MSGYELSLLGRVLLNATDQEDVHVMTLADFLLARIAEDEERGRSLVAQWFDVGNACQSCGTDGVRVLAECEAKRRIVSQKLIHSGGEDPVTDLQYDTLCLLALPYADHPDYRAEWRP